MIEPPDGPIRLGDWQLETLDTGRFALDGGAMFGSVPRVLWERRIPPDELHRIPLALRLLLLRHRSGTPIVLVDTGMGDKFDDSFREMFDVSRPDLEGAHPVLSALAAVGVSPESVTDLILTHLHFDHAGGVSRREGDELRPTFPRSRHWLQRANLETAESPNPRERASYLAENVQPLRDVKLELLDGETELFDGLRVIPSNGHTRGMQTVRVEGGGEVVHFLADLAPTHHHLHLPFTMGYDLCAREIMAEKQRLFARAVEEEATVVFEHDAQVTSGKIVEVKGKFRLAEGS